MACCFKIRCTGARLRLRGSEELACRAVVGADGVRSAIAASLGVPPPNVAGYSAYRRVAAVMGILSVHHDSSVPNGETHSINIQPQLAPFFYPTIKSYPLLLPALCLGFDWCHVCGAGLS